MVKAAPFGRLAKFHPLGEYGCDFVEKQSVFSGAVATVNQPNAFVPAQPFGICCIDDRAENTTSNFVNMPGAGVMLGLMWQFVNGGAALVDCVTKLAELGFHFHFHPDCYALAHTGEVIKEVIADPTHEMEFLRWLGLGVSFGSRVLIELDSWVNDRLPGDFISSCLHKLEMAGTTSVAHNPLGAVINRYQVGKTFALQAQMPVVAEGYRVFALDMWAGDYYARQFTTDSFVRECVTALYQLVSVGLLRRLGSKNLGLLVC